jgi:hypothetical protein
MATPPPPQQARPVPMATPPPPVMSSSSAPPPPPPPQQSGSQFAGGAALGGANAPRKNILAIVSLSSGIASLILCCCFLWFPTSIVAIVTGFLGRKQIAESGGTQDGDKLALAGMICGAVAFVIYLLLSIAAIIFNVAVPGTQVLGQQ